jgi:hypothetical protein
MPGQFGCKQRHRNGSCLHRREEPCDVLEALRRQDRHPVAGGGDLLNARADGLQSDAQLSPGDFGGLPGVRTGEVEVAVGHCVADVLNVAVDKRYQRDPRWQDDAAVGVEAVLDLQQPGHDRSVCTAAPQGR